MLWALSFPIQTREISKTISKGNILQIFCNYRILYALLCWKCLYGNNTLTRARDSHDPVSFTFYDLLDYWDIYKENFHRFHIFHIGFKFFIQDRQYSFNKLFSNWYLRLFSIFFLIYSLYFTFFYFANCVRCWRGPSWSWSYGTCSWIYSYLHVCNQCLSPLTLLVQIPVKARCTRMIQHFVVKFVSDWRQVSGFPRVLWFPPPIKVTATI